MENDLLELGFGAGKLFVVDNYLEAVGVMAALKSGVALESVRRPLAGTKVVCDCTTPCLVIKRKTEPKG